MLTPDNKSLISELADDYHTRIVFSNKVRENKELFKRLVEEGYLVPSNPNLIITRKLKEEMKWK